MKRKIFLNISIIISISIIVALYGMIGFRYKEIIANSTIDISGNKIVSEKNMEKDYVSQDRDITNMLIIGSDARSSDKKSRSDTIMVCSLHKQNNSIKIMSIMRDSYAHIPGHGYQKINHAFAYGGAELLKKTVESNFGIGIDKYVVVNFQVFKDVIDIIGGIDVELDELAIEDLNNCMYGIREENIVEVSEVGMNHLNGMQALAYARMRHNGKGIYDRSKRQRDILQTTIEKSKEVSLLKYPSLAKAILKSIKTDIGINESLKLGYMIYSMKDPQLKQMHIPPIEYSENTTIENKGWVVKFSKPEVKDAIQKFIYE